MRTIFSCSTENFPGRKNAFHHTVILIYFYPPKVRHDRRCGGDGKVHIVALPEDTLLHYTLGSAGKCNFVWENGTFPPLSICTYITTHRTPILNCRCCFRLWKINVRV